MPYVPLPPVDRQGRLALAEARWTSMAQARPDLGPAIALQRKLIGRVFDLTADLDAARLRRLSLPHRYVTTKLGAGIPALTGEPIQLPVPVLKPALLDLCRLLAEGGGGQATLAIQSALEEGRFDVPALLTLTLRREQAALRAAATRAGLGHDLVWLLADLTVGPYAHALLDAVFGPATPGSPLRTALDHWIRGYCPLCGSWPSLVEDVDAHRRLRCSFCAAAWEVPAGACLYCADTAQLTSLAPDSARPARHVELCGTCRGYTKVVPTAASLPFPLVALADLESMDLDLAAMQHGCARPAIRQFARR